MDSNELEYIKEQLKEIIENEPGTIRAMVAQEALDYGDGEVISFFRDLFEHGCVSGMVSSLIYYVDTAKFFDRHYVEIENLRFVHLDSGGEPLQFDGDLKNAMAWFGFEETARMVADELAIDP